MLDMIVQENASKAQRATPAYAWPRVHTEDPLEGGNSYHYGMGSWENCTDLSVHSSCFILDE